jgi:hypothetical protein
MWDAPEIALDLASFACLTDELSSRDVDALGMLDKKTHPVREAPLQQSPPPYVLTLDLHQKP